MISVFNLEPLYLRLMRIELKLDRLMEQDGIEEAGIEEAPIPGVTKEASDKIMGFILDNQKIPAIKEYRIATGTSLKNAKSVIDALYRSLQH